ncbi:MAG TPA: HD-GYP domain-containing protein [Methylomusa anaerophila]|uniref:Cyclic di-GMP phosphodiesterase response regulator RpfG n=1 Tax=Methylomusa anaerophila TaxID=1930071 RepID=A0A348AK94_9FIRM|nr:HD-GYP domain-containing protein [Methylomusa anaerophila]BBB91492.1 cyclic di-GMP phosphodiesterase response regulator RpfG [Methylomusa anaerophila]HML89919.1 HD-GYP domain-containing protein [Methylomusa anaerophila]
MQKVQKVQKMPVTMPEIIREETRIRAIDLVQKSFRNLGSIQQLNIVQFNKLTSFIIDEIISNTDAMIHLTDIRLHDDYTFGHSVNVCVLSTVIGLQLGYRMSQLRELALGALLHDIGKVQIPQEILQKPGKLDDREWNIMCQHPDLGFAILREREEIPLLSAYIVRQHHEKCDGTGYSHGLSAKAIHEYAKIAAVADVYDAITSSRPYQNAALPHEAHEMMVSMAHSHLDEGILKSFLSQVAVYPVGTILRLSTGELAVVTKVIPGLQTRPVVRIIADEQNRPIVNGRQVDLARHLSLFILQVLTEREICQLKQTT